MKKLAVLISILFLFLSTTVSMAAAQDKQITIKNSLFQITLPKEFKNFYIAKIKKDKIFIYDKELKKAGFGGFAFGISAYKNISDYAGSPSAKKIGELVNKKSVLYDVILECPTEVQHDYTKGENPPETYKALYDYGQNVDIIGVNGSTYYKNQGTKGKDLYNEILEKHIKAIKEKWDSIKLENEDMSYMYNVISSNSDNSKVLNKIGYKYYDINADGIDELLIGEIADDEWKGVVYDIYAMVNRKAKHVISGGSRNRFYVCNGSFLCNEYSSGAMERGIRIYSLVENSIEIFPQVAFKYDEYENQKNPYFIAYGDFQNDENWQNVDKKTYTDRLKTFEKYQRFDYIPLSTYIN